MGHFATMKVTIVKKGVDLVIKEFKEFIMKGDVLDLAVGVVIGGAFTAIVNGLVTGLITPLINLVFIVLFHQKQSEAFDALVVNVRGAKFDFGLVISAIITFIITGFVLFLIVKTANKFRNKGQAEKEVVAAPKAEDYLAEIRDLLVTQNTELRKDTPKKEGR